jgi:hypothetical protein
MRRLERAAKQRRQSKNAFVQESVMSAVVAFEERFKEPAGASEAHKKHTAPPPIDTSSGGLGIASALQRKPREQPEPAAFSSAAPVVVNVGNTNAPASGSSAPLSDLDRMAFYIVKGDDFLREARKRNMIEVLRASANTDEEFNVLVAQLEQVIAVKTKTVEENSPANKLARFAFDKLTSLLKGD